LINYENYVGRVNKYIAEFQIVKVIKIIKSEVIDESLLTLPDAAGLHLAEFSAESINLEGNAVKRTIIEKKDILIDNIQKNVKLHKVNLPNIKDGSIIFYTFTYKFDLARISKYFDFDWAFQSTYPTLSSAFELTIAPHSNCQITPKNTSFTPVFSEDELWRSTSGTFSTVIKTTKGFEEQIFRKRLWHRTNLPATVPEPFVVNQSDHIEKLNLSLVTRNNRMYQQPMPQSWDSANKQFYYDDFNYGTIPFKTISLKDTLLEELITKYPDKYELANIIYRYFRDTVSSPGLVVSLNEYVRLSANKKRKKVRGSDHNLLLVRMLRRAGINAFPVILSTTGNGKLAVDQFEPSKINYVVCLVVIKERLYYLDASWGYLPFGTLRPECYNGFAWIINEKGMGISMNADSLSDKNICMATLKPTDQKNIFSLKMDEKAGNVTGPLIRSLWTKDSVETRKYLDKEIQQLNYKTKVLNWSIANIYKPDTSVILSSNQEIELKASGNYIYLNPFFKPIVDKNPFTDVSRKETVEFPHAQNSQFILKFTLPDGYSPEEYEELTNISFKNGAITYTRATIYEPDQHLFSVSCTFRLNTTKIPIEDYKELRSFYESVAADQHKSIVLKKIN
jgi:hypothetical protein